MTFVYRYCGGRFACTITTSTVLFLIHLSGRWFADALGQGGGQFRRNRTNQTGAGCAAIIVSPPAFAGSLVGTGQSFSTCPGAAGAVRGGSDPARRVPQSATACKVRLGIVSLYAPCHQ